MTLALAVFDAQGSTSKKILVLYSFSDLNIYSSPDALESAIRSQVPWPVDFYVENLDAQRFENAGYEISYAATLRATYGAERLDLVLVAGASALNFAVKHRDRIFPSVPIVFFNVDRKRIPAKWAWTGVTGVTEDVDVPGTISLALHLHPRTNTVAVITNNSGFEKYWLGRVHTELLRHGDQVHEVDLVGLTTDELFEEVSALPTETIILFQQSTQGSIQPAMGPYDTLRRIGERLPTYCIFPILCLDHGGIGGVDTDTGKQVSLTAQLAARVLNGERPESIPVVNDMSSVVHLDWRELRRWDIEDSTLPPGAVVLFREPTVWQRDRKYILPAFVVIGFQSLLIIGLLWQRARKRKAEAVLRESERRFRVMADSTPSLIWMCDDQGKVTYINEQRVLFTGSDPQAGYGDTWAAYIHPNDLWNVENALSKALKNHQPFSKEYRLRRKDGVYRWMFDVAVPRFNGDGSFAGFIGSAVDVTDQKLAREALEKVSGQLIDAQEKERSRLARELHDDICQRLAMISLKIEKTSKGWGRPQSSIPDQLEQIWQQCSNLAGDVQALSHELHPSILYNLGLATALKSFCRDVSEQNDAVVDFVANNLPTSLPSEVSLSLFRVVQEALHNAVKYSGQKHFEVHLQEIAGELELEVMDRGKGFDPKKMKGGGLGLVSMAERIHHVNGTFRIDSQPNAGTRIHARVPIAPLPKPSPPH
jgi:PAS domain S-box-containing protein